MNIYEKLLNIQHELKAPKNCRNTFGNYNYRSAEGILEALKPICFKYRAVLRMTDEIMEIGGKNFVKAIAELIDVEISNPSADTIFAIGSQGWAQIPESKKGLDSAQIVGSSSSYARKYCLNALFCIDDQRDSDALPPDKDAEKEEAMQKNQAKLDAMENWRIFDGGVVLVKAKTRNGDFEWKNLDELTLKALEYLKTDARFEGIQRYVDERIAIIKGAK